MSDPDTQASELRSGNRTTKIIIKGSAGIIALAALLWTNWDKVKDIAWALVEEQVEESTDKKMGPVLERINRLETLRMTESPEYGKDLEAKVREIKLCNKRHTEHTAIDISGDISESVVINNFCQWQSVFE